MLKHLYHFVKNFSSKFTVGMGFNGWTLPVGTANFTDAYKVSNI